MSYTIVMSHATHRQTRERRIAPSLVVSSGIWFAIFCWGGAYVAARFLLHPVTATSITLSPLQLATLRFGIASLFFVIPFARAIIYRQISVHTIFLMAILGLLTFTLYYWLQYIGIAQTSASIASILGVGLIPLFTTLLAPLFGEERLNPPLLALVLLGFAGVALIVFQQPLHVIIQSGFLLGAGCLITNTFLFALYNHLSKRWMRNISPAVLTGCTMISGALGLLILSCVDPTSHWESVPLLDASQWLAILFLALACSVLAYFAYNIALSKIDASRVAVYFYFEPVVSVVLGVLLLGEQLTWQTLLGTAIIGGSIVTVNRMKQ
jgi:drug/metabolite transporter (DMT)-like permease